MLVVSLEENMKKDEKLPQNEIVLGIIKNKLDKIVVIERLWKEKSIDGFTNLTWAFPGGEIDEGETSKEALIREIRNETGLRVKVIKKISERTHPQFRVKITYFACGIIPGGVRPIVDVHEVESLKWVSAPELKNYFTTDLDPGVAKYLRI